jgi:hypothetical protein
VSSLNPLLLLGLVITVAFVAVAILKKRRHRPESGASWPFYAKRPLSQPEQVLYHRLVGALPDHIVLAQVQVSRVLGVKKGFSFHEWNNRINRLSYDFVVCARDSTVVAAIELDDKSHESDSRLATDLKKDRATASAGVRLIRWHVKALPDTATIQQTFSDNHLTAASSALAVHELPGLRAGARGIHGDPKVKARR